MNLADIAAQLKAARPKKIKVVCTDGTERAVAVPGGRTKWHTAARVIDGMSWSDVYCLDGTGAATAVIRQEDSPPPDGLEDLQKHHPTAAIVTAVVAALAPLTREIHRTATEASVELLTKLRDTARQENADVISGYRDIANAALERGTSMEERGNALMAENDQLREQVAQLQAAVMRKSAEDDGMGDDVKSIVKAWMGVPDGKTKAPDDGGGSTNGNGAKES